MSTGHSTIARRNVLQWVGAGSIAALAGCTGNDDEPDEESAPEPEAVDVSESTTWRTASLTDVTTDEEYRIEEFDRPAIIHTFAVDCAVCQAQHGEFDDFLSSAGVDAEIVDITIDPKDDPDDLRTHAEEEGYEWRFTVAPDEVTGDLSSDFGREVFSSADSPVIIDCPSGDVYRVDKIVDAEHLESILADVCGTSA